MRKHALRSLEQQREVKQPAKLAAQLDAPARIGELQTFYLEVTTSYSYIGCYGRVTNDSNSRDAHAENAGYIG